MTHDELLISLKVYAASAIFRMDRNAWLILSDVVELHKPFLFEDAPDVYYLACVCQTPVVGEKYPCETIEQTIQLMNQKIYTLLEEDGVNNLDKIKELTRSIQRIKRAR